MDNLIEELEAHAQFLALDDKRRYENARTIELLAMAIADLRWYENHSAQSHGVINKQRAMIGVLKKRHPAAKIVDEIAEINRRSDEARGVFRP